MSRATERRWQPPRFVDETFDEDRVRRGLVAQHELLRARLAALDAQALEIVRGGSCTPAELAEGFGGLAALLADHMRNEEGALAQLLPRTAAAARALAFVRDEHRRQRQELEAMSRLAARGDDAITLALAVRAFVCDVRLDMDAEDSRYLAGPPLEGALP